MVEPSVRLCSQEEGIILLYIGYGIKYSQICHAAENPATEALMRFQHSGLSHCEMISKIETVISQNNGIPT